MAKKKRKKKQKSVEYDVSTNVPVWQMDERALRKHRIRTEGLVPKKTWKIFGAVAILLLILGIVLAVLLKTYAIKTVYVEGNKHYTNEEIIERVMSGRLEHNSIYLNFKYRHQKIESIPFVSALEVKILAPDAVKITVYEKSLAGYVSYLGRYMYFDKDGTVVESSDVSMSDVPQVTGLHFDYVVMYEKLPVEGNGLFSTILDITQTLSKFELTADQIFFDQNKDITLYFGDVRVQIGAGDNLDDKFAKIQSILPELEGKKGVLHMADYTSDSRNITFESDDNLGQ